MRVVGARRDRMKNNRLRSLFSDRKFRSGALSAALSLLVVFSLLAAVFVMDTVEKKYALQADYSYNQYIYRFERNMMRFENILHFPKIQKIYWIFFFP